MYEGSTHLLLLIRCFARYHFLASQKTQKSDGFREKKIREDYEKKLAAMRLEYKKLRSVEKEHRQMRSKQIAEQQQLVRLRNELNDLKKTKVCCHGLRRIEVLVVVLSILMEVFLFFLNICEHALNSWSQFRLELCLFNCSKMSGVFNLFLLVLQAVTASCVIF